MKLTQNKNTKIKPGVTLIELTVVILVLLTLIGVLFIGAGVYKRGADRAACILNIRNIHQAVRANQNLNAINAGATLDMDAEIYSDSGGSSATERFLTEPDCPTDGGAYTPVTMYPEIGVVAVVCSTNGADSVGDIIDHFPTDTAGW